VTEGEPLNTGMPGTEVTVSIEENRKRYEGSSLEALMKASDHQICERCYCCDRVSASETCWACNGVDEDDDDYSGYFGAPCRECDGEGRIFRYDCLGNCDENGNHEKGES